MFIKNISSRIFSLSYTSRTRRFLTNPKNFSIKNSAQNVQNSNSKIFLKDKYSSFTFDELNRLSTKLSSDLLASLNRNDLQGEKIAVLCANNYTYLISILAIWMANGVPLGKSFLGFVFLIRKEKSATCFYKLLEMCI